MKLFFVSSNRHKIKEIKSILVNLDPNIELVTLLDYPELEQNVDETGGSYHENALIKARAYQSLVSYPVIADDSGIEVAAFPHLLGIHSARWVSGSDRDRLNALLDKLKTQQNRQLAYHCTICLLLPSQPAQFFDGIWPGQAALAPSGSGGFGYDPIFIPDGFNQPLGELGDELKNKHSHRYQALAKLAAALKNMV